MKQQMVILGRLAGLNELLDANRRHWAVGAKLKKKEMRRVEEFIMINRLRETTGKATITISCYEPNARRDEDNVKAGASKIILDALQKSGIIRGDGRKYINLIQPAVEVDRVNPRIEVIIESD